MIKGYFKIAIRNSIIMLLSKDLIRLVIIAFVIAAPIAWVVMNKWLQSYAYRIQIQWWMIVSAACIAILIAWMTVAWHAFKVANNNAVNSLRDE